ncbi:hypothetical protein GCM10025867_48630 (plasmid) [Frondihabitans sucicola]|uniref:Uncharacterized protein n=1 Tax=Frondihabitans sucicola TaxID=1268041 RepID=A0ABM8GW59_9MICO|nr:hypothetical protein [Frondihabitans sucicola]BDZ52622.1 hypothetical protein GCM10025867_48630 [Frondihabitans sucicola]
MKLNVTFDWNQTNVIPPRCRNPRTVAHEGLTLEVDFRSVTGAEAPVAIRYTNAWDKTFELRWFEGQLWVRHLPNSGQTDDTILGSASFPLEPRFTGWSSIVPRTDELPAAEAAIQAHFDQYIAIDSVIYQRGNEPKYNIDHNPRYGAPAYIHLAENGRRVEGRNYSALDYDLASADLQSILENRPTMDTNADTGKVIDVLIPEAVQFVTDSYEAVVGEVGMAHILAAVVEAQGHEADEETPVLASQALEAMIELRGWAATYETLCRWHQDASEVERHVSAGLFHAGIATSNPTIVRTVYVFEVLHRADEQPQDIASAVRAADDGHAVGQTLSEVTAGLADALVPSALRRLGNDGDFFAIDLDAEAYAD